MDEFELFEELGKGNYGTVQKVVHKPTAVTMALKVSERAAGNAPTGFPFGR